MEIDLRIVLAEPSDSDLVGQLVYDLLIELYADQSHLFPTEIMKKAAGNLLKPESGV